MLKKLINKILGLFHHTAKKDTEKWLACRERYHGGGCGSLRRRLLQIRYGNLVYASNAYFPISVPVGAGLRLPHGLCGIFVSEGARIGENCTIMQHVTIGSNTMPGAKRQGAPTIGDNVFIGAGAVILGAVRVGDNVRIGANATVTQDVPDDCTVVSEGTVRILPAEPGRDNRYRTYREWQAARENERA
ncbi:MAG: serine acetyltransferase [Oscillospiraceae bacterium]|nr:serine acetyltransferase [Oscillospiraceae bacterium]